MWAYLHHEKSEADGCLQFGNAVGVWKSYKTAKSFKDLSAALELMLYLTWKTKNIFIPDFIRYSIHFHRSGAHFFIRFFIRFLSAFYPFFIRILHFYPHSTRFSSETSALHPFPIWTCRFLPRNASNFVKRGRTTRRLAGKYVLVKFSNSYEMLVFLWGRTPLAATTLPFGDLDTNFNSYEKGHNEKE